MGKATLRSHMKGKRHTDLVPALSDKESQSELVAVPAPASTGTFEVEIYNNTSAPTENSVISTTQCSTAYKTVGTMQVGIAKNDTLTSEIWWSLKVISSHYSYKSAAGINLLFQKIFMTAKLQLIFNVVTLKRPI